MIRADAREKVRGAAAFGMDLEAPGMLWAALVGAPVSHGRLTNIDLRAARRAPGVYAAVGPEDLRDLLPKGGGDPERTVFPTAEVQYRCQPLAAIAARTLGEARRAVRRVKIDVDPLPATAEIDDVFPDWPGSDGKQSPHVIAHVHAQHGDLDAAFSNADFVHRESYRTNGVHQVAIEPHACLAKVDGDQWRVTTSTQSPFGVREDAATILGIPEEKLVVEGTWVGGGFGGKAAAFVEPYALVLARATGRPVRLSLTYREEFLLGRTTLPSRVWLETAVRGGTMTARRVHLLLDAGASLPGRDFATGYAIGFLLGPYRAPAIELEGYAIRTNKPPFGPHRAPFVPQCVFMAESHIDGIARQLGVDPIDFRLQHIWHAGDTTPLGQTVSSFGGEAALLRARSLANRWRTELGHHQGIGVGIGFWSTGVGAGGEATLSLRPDELVITQVEHDIGNGSVVRGLAAAAERVLGIPPGHVRVESRDTALAPFDSGVFGSRTVGALGQAVEKAAHQLLSTLGSRLRPPAEIRLEWRNGQFVALNGKRKALVRNLLTADELKTNGLQTRGKHYGQSGTIDEARVRDGSFFAYSDFTATAHLAQVEVDRGTGMVRVLRSAGFPDVGTLVDSEMVRGQVEGGVVMGLGTALTEEMLWSGDGRLMNPGLLDYRIPTIGDVPPIEVDPIEGFPGAGPFGAKGVGEPPIVPVPAAVANAVADATGARITELPLTAERVARALKLL